MLHHPQGLAERLLQVGLLNQSAAIGHTGGIGQALRRQAVAAAQFLGDGGLYVLHGCLGLRLAGYGAQLPPLKGEGGGSGVKHPVCGKDGQQKTGGKEHRRLDKAVIVPRLPRLDLEGQGGKEGADLIGGAVNLLPQQRHAARQQQLELAGGAVGLRKPAVDPANGSPERSGRLGCNMFCLNGSGFCRCFLGRGFFINSFFGVLLDHYKNPPIVTKRCEGLQIVTASILTYFS